jgi:hypothetical protein
MSAQHTPGPWSIITSDTCDLYAGIESDNFSIVVIGYPEEDDDGGVRGRTLEEATANAHLIAAAPDLLEALEAVMPYIVGDKCVPWQKAQSAIAKAKGEAK